MTLPVSWTTVSMMLMTLPAVGSRMNIGSAELANFAGRAEATMRSKWSDLYSFSQFIFCIILYARYKLWAKGLDHVVSPVDLIHIIRSDLSKWNFAIENTRFDSDHDVFSSVWKHTNIFNMF